MALRAQLLREGPVSVLEDTGTELSLSSPCTSISLRWACQRPGLADFFPYKSVVFQEISPFLLSPAVIEVPSDSLPKVSRISQNSASIWSTSIWNMNWSWGYFRFKLLHSGWCGNPIILQSKKKHRRQHLELFSLWKTWKIRTLHKQLSGFFPEEDKFWIVELQHSIKVRNTIEFFL